MILVFIVIQLFSQQQTFYFCAVAFNEISNHRSCWRSLSYQKYLAYVCLFVFCTFSVSRGPRPGLEPTCVKPRKHNSSKGSLCTKRLTISLFSAHSKNNRGCKGPLRIIYCKPLLEAGCLGHVQTCFGYLQGWRLYSFSEQPVPVFNHSKNYSFV